MSKGKALPHQDAFLQQYGMTANPMPAQQFNDQFPPSNYSEPNRGGSGSDSNDERTFESQNGLNINADIFIPTGIDIDFRPPEVHENVKFKFDNDPPEDSLPAASPVTNASRSSGSVVKSQKSTASAPSGRSEKNNEIEKPKIKDVLGPKVPKFMKSIWKKDAPEDKPVSDIPSTRSRRLDKPRFPDLQADVLPLAGTTADEYFRSIDESSKIEYSRSRDQKRAEKQTVLFEQAAQKAVEAGTLLPEFQQIAAFAADITQTEIDSAAAARAFGDVPSSDCGSDLSAAKMLTKEKQKLAAIKAATVKMERLQEAQDAEDRANGVVKEEPAFDTEESSRKSTVPIFPPNYEQMKLYFNLVSEYVEFQKDASASSHSKVRSKNQIHYIYHEKQLNYLIYFRSQLKKMVPKVVLWIFLLRLNCNTRKTLGLCVRNTHLTRSPHSTNKANLSLANFHQDWKSQLTWRRIRARGPTSTLNLSPNSVISKR